MPDRRTEWGLFLSHSTADIDFTRRLALDVEEAGVRVWFAEWQMSVGDSLREKIEKDIQGSAFLGVVLSPNSVQSRWVRVELNAAFAREMAQRSVFVLPILYRKCTMPPFLQDKV